jgi:hypothetical protein
MLFKCGMRGADPILGGTMVGFTASVVVVKVTVALEENIILGDKDFGGLSIDLF